MKGKRATEEQIIRVLKDAEEIGNVRDACRKHNITEQTFYRWRNKYGGMDVSEAKRLKQLEKENNDLKKLVADLSLDNRMLRDVNGKNVWSAPDSQVPILVDLKQFAIMYPASCKWTAVAARP